MDALDLLSNDNYITVNKTLIKEIGLENAIVFGVLCGYQRGYGSEEFYKEQEKIIDDTGLSEYLVRKSIKELTDLKYILVVKKGMPAKYHYKINVELLTFKISTSSGVKFDTTCDSKNETTNKNNNKNELNNIDNKYIEKENIKEKVDYSGSVIIPPKKVEELTKGSNALNIFHHWNESNIIQHRELTTGIRKQIDKVLKEYSIEQIKIAISHYAEALHSDYEYCSYKWSLEKFLKQDNCLKDFLDDGSKWINYLEYKNKKTYSNKKELSKETSYPDYKDKNYL